jgi:hypothetical protein
MSEQSAIEQLDHEIADEEQRLIRIVDRIDAMGELRHAAADVQKTLDRPVTFDDLLPACETPRDRAKLFSLLDRIAPPDRTGPSGLADREIGGHRLDGADGLAGLGGKVPS